MGHALAKGVWGFGFWRGFLGVSEAGNFPSAIKVVAEWFPKKERAFATGLYNSGANMTLPPDETEVQWTEAAWVSGRFGMGAAARPAGGGETGNG